MRPAGLFRMSQLAISLAAGIVSCGGRGAEEDRGHPDSDFRASEITELQFERARIEEGVPVDLRDETGGAWRVVEVPQLGSLRGLVDSPVGWLALSFRQLGDGRAPSASQSVLYRSRDGVRWEAVPVAEGHNDLLWRGLAYGNGIYAVSGGRGTFGNDGAVWTSTDSSSWTEHPVSVDVTNYWRELAYAGQQFFALGTYGFSVSRDGAHWSSVAPEMLQPTAVAYGGGRYVVVGRPVEVSDDGENWQAHPVDCEAFDDCPADPDGASHPTYLGNVIFAEGRFHSRERISDDGESWELAPGRSPVAYFSGRFFEGEALSYIETYWGDGNRERLRLVRPSIRSVQMEHRSRVGWLGRNETVPEVVEVPFEDGLTCEVATCVRIGQRLLLIPPEGTPPLVDRLPRRADGRPLLSDECPVSSQIFCSDYASRRDCHCDPEAPDAPDACPDVSEYECEGRFEPLGDEWRVDDVAEAGCSCTATDPNQPATLGQDCSPEESHCVPPLACLSVDRVPSPGPPPPLRFVCTASCSEDADCPSWQATGFCAGSVQLRCSSGSCQPRKCD